MIKLLICGGRNIKDAKLINREINNFLREKQIELKDLVIIEGGAKGVDTIAKYWAQFNNVPFEEYPADWDTYGKSAGIIRNEKMVKLADLVLIFWDGKSRGTKNSLDLCKKYNKDNRLININNMEII